KEGYTWSKWIGTTSSTKKQYNFLVVSNASLSAEATANTYHIVFHANGGSGYMKPITLKYNETYTLPQNAYSNTSMQCTYVGWSTDWKALRQIYKDGQQVKNLTSEDGKIIILYAVWDMAP